MTDRGSDTIEVIVALDADAAKAGTSKRETLEAQAARLGAALAPLHPSTSDANLAAYAVAYVDAASADTVIEHLLRCPGVEAAYAKPRGAPPERRSQDVSRPL